MIFLNNLDLRNLYLYVLICNLYLYVQKLGNVHLVFGKGQRCPSFISRLRELNEIANEKHRGEIINAKNFQRLKLIISLQSVKFARWTNQ